LTFPYYRYEDQSVSILTALASNDTYPWGALCALNAPKFFSDIVESTLCAIYVDENGDLTKCVAYLENLGLLRYLRRIVKDNVDTMHPKERLNQMATGLRYQTVKMEGCEGVPIYRCTVSGNDEILAKEWGGTNMEAEIRVAEAAIKHLKLQEYLSRIEFAT
jgi:dsRNA-specific ribonuclease